MIKLIINIADEFYMEVLEEYLDDSVCLSFSLTDGSAPIEVACGQLQEVTEDGVSIWHLGESRTFSWDSFDEVNVFYG